MDSISTLKARSSSILNVRDDSSTTTMSNSMVDLLIALMVLVFVGLVLTGALYVVRKLRRNRAVARQQLPLHNEPPKSNHRRLTITATPYGGRGSTIHVYDEKSSMMASDRAPLSPEDVPEIRITFPDEHDESTGHKKSGRVVVVRVGETGVGLEPLKDQDQLPAYEKETGGTRFQSIDMDRIGGLKEKESWS
ncbi:hypothetical protein SBOR_0282 [Sclerotinia borealis F-4128]|uniref:Herpesvirus latent membrane protein 1 (LMP1) domain-containing protein n=1 Tax=Sclerotinia borealis (strain F-4128) TaxID=1432307 RepID=W9CXG1_SCLBF|nr:hypothetical protein SBOR_0282 [Sclerotinia borealis F-4128]